jgi:hypothetical protein
MCFNSRIIYLFLKIIDHAEKELVKDDEIIHKKMMKPKILVIILGIDNKINMKNKS